jgi:hypothetical protein
MAAILPPAAQGVRTAASASCNSVRRELQFGMISQDEEPVAGSASPLACQAVYRLSDDQP